MPGDVLGHVGLEIKQMPIWPSAVDVASSPTAKRERSKTSDRIKVGRTRSRSASPSGKVVNTRDTFRNTRDLLRIKVGRTRSRSASPSAKVVNARDPLRNRSTRRSCIGSQRTPSTAVTAASHGMEASGTGTCPVDAHVTGVDELIALFTAAVTADGVYSRSSTPKSRTSTPKSRFAVKVASPPLERRSPESRPRSFGGEDWEEERLVYFSPPTISSSMKLSPADRKSRLQKENSLQRPGSAPPKIQCLRTCNPIVSTITSAPTKLRHSTHSHSDEKVLSELVNSNDQENFGFDVFSRPSVQPNSLRALLNHETLLRKRSEGTNMNSIRVRMPCLPDTRGSSITSLSVLSYTNKGLVSKD